MPRWCHPLSYIYFTPHSLHFLSDKIKPGYIISIKSSQVFSFLKKYLKKEKFTCNKIGLASLLLLLATFRYRDLPCAAVDILLW